MSQILAEAALGRVEAVRRADPAQWEGLAREARREGLEGLLYCRCLEAGIEIPARVVAAWRAAYRQTAGCNFAALRRLGEVLGKGRVQVLVLPGAALLPLYPDPGCRPMDDIDVLAAPGQSAALLAALRELGLRSPERHPDLLAGAGLVLDVHEDLLNCTRVRTRRYAGWMDPAEVWGDAEELCVEGVALKVPCAEDLALYTAVHALRHSYRRLTWFLDLHLLLPRLRWARLQAKAERYRLQRPLAYGLRFLRDSLSIPLTGPAGEWLAGRREQPLEARILRRAFAERGRSEWGDVLWSFSIEGGGRRLLFLAETFFPAPRVLLQVFPFLPLPLFPLAYGLRCGQLLLRGGRQLAGMVRGK